MKTKSAAVLTVFDAPRMTAAGRRMVAAWMERQAKFLRSHGKKMSSRFTARYLY